MLTSHLQQLCKELEIDDVPEDEGDERFSFPINANTFIRLAAVDDAIYMSANLGAVPQDNQEEIFTKLLHSNLFGVGTDHASLGMNGSGENLTLSLAVRDASDYKAFRDNFEEFMNMVDYWKDEVQTSTA